MNYKAIIERADARLKTIGYESSKLNNEKVLLERIQQAADMEWGEVCAGLLSDYRNFYGTK